MAKENNTQFSGGFGRCRRGRPRKMRFISNVPGVVKFVPSPRGGCCGIEPVEMSLEEYEVLRLVDYEGLTQDAAGEKLGVSRGSVQRAYAKAREKMAKMIVEGRALVVISEKAKE